jgi:hypothetical protein
MDLVPDRSEHLQVDAASFEAIPATVMVAFTVTMTCGNA